MYRSFSSWLPVIVCGSVVALCASAGSAFADEQHSAKAEASISDSVDGGAKTAEHAPAMTDAAHPHSEGGHPAGAAAENGPPMSFTADLALWSAIVFVLFLFVLKKFAWLPMIEGLDKREEGIRKAISDAEDGRRKSHAMLAEYEQKLKAAEQTVAGMVAEARRDAERTGQDLIANAQREVEAIKVRAKDEILRAKNTALVEVFTQMNSQVVQATEHVLGRALQDTDQDRLVGEALAGIGR